MDTAVGQSLLHGLLNQRCRILLMQTQHVDKLFHPPSFRPFFLQESQQPMVSLGPFFAPAFERARILKGAWSLFEQRQVMQRIEDILLTTVAARMAGNHLAFMPDVNADWVGFDHQLAARLLYRDRVPVA